MMLCPLPFHFQSTLSVCIILHNVIVLVKSLKIVGSHYVLTFFRMVLFVVISDILFTKTGHFCVNFIEHNI